MQPSPVPPGVTTAAPASPGLLDRHPAIIVLGLLALCLAVTVPHALAKPFWHDEIYTILVSRLPSFGAMWTAALSGVDLSPPLSVWLTRAAHSVTGVGPISTRLPAMCGFYLSVVVVFLLLRRRVGSTGALAGSLFLLYTAAPRYAAEARSYGVMLGLFAGVLFFWMEAAAGRRRAIYIPLLTISLAASLWNHYYGVLVFAPVLAGEAARCARNRRVDLPVAVAIGAALAAVVPLFPLMRVASAQRGTFWLAAAPGEQLFELHQFLIQPLVDAPLVLAGVLLAVLLSRLPVPGRHTTAAVVQQHELAAVLVALTIPLLGFLLGRFVTGGLAPRYILNGAVAVSIAVPMALTSRGRRKPVADLLLLFVLGLGATTAAVGAWYPARTAMTDPVASRPLLTGSLRQPGPTVISGSLQFLPVWYYTPQALKPKLLYVASTQEAMRWSRSDTIDRGYQALARTVSLPVMDYETFVRTHIEFRVYDNGSGWLLDALSAAGATVEIAGAEPGGRLLLVRLPTRGQ
ncbi:MAG: glycosyltransferase family 39 protein [Acidobacteriota bacterium]|nr:glycosyltransferase family 39 protein [Acidobacteriota bacterium]